MFKSQTCKRLILSDIAVSLIFFGIGIFAAIFFNDFFKLNILSFTLGMIFGTAFTVLKIMLLEKTVQKAVDMPKEKAVNYTRLHYTLRYILTGAVVAVAAVNTKVSLFGTVLALAALWPAVHAAAKLEKRAEAEKQQP